jgi:NADH dehydrogenase
MKDVVDAFRIRNHILQCLEYADETTDSVRKLRLLTFVVVGDFTGVEAIGEVQVTEILPQPSTSRDPDRPDAT